MCSISALASLKLIFKFQIHPPWMMANAPLVVIKCAPYQDKAYLQNSNTENTNRQPDCINNNTSPSPWRRLPAAEIHVSAPKAKPVWHRLKNKKKTFKSNEISNAQKGKKAEEGGVGGGGGHGPFHVHAEGENRALQLLLGTLGSDFLGPSGA